MDFPWIPLFFNFLLLGIVLFVCRTINASHGKLLWNGALIYFVFCFLAMVLDFTLTMVFASASFHDHTQYETVASRMAWAGRFFGYLAPCAVSLVMGLLFRKRQQSAASPARAIVDTAKSVAPGEASAAVAS
jgi:bacteriorhodopsin